MYSVGTPPSTAMQTNYTVVREFGLRQGSGFDEPSKKLVVTGILETVSLPLTREYQ